MSKHNIMNLPADYALVLQQIREEGEGDVSSLAETLHLNRARIKHIIKSLQSKGLLLVKSSSYGEAWVRLSRKGQRMVTYIWPEQSFIMSR